LPHEVVFRLARDRRPAAAQVSVTPSHMGVFYRHHLCKLFISGQSCSTTAGYLSTLRSLETSGTWAIWIATGDQTLYQLSYSASWFCTAQSSFYARAVGSQVILGIFPEILVFTWIWTWTSGTWAIWIATGDQTLYQLSYSASYEWVS